MILLSLILVKKIKVLDSYLTVVINSELLIHLFNIIIGTQQCHLSECGAQGNCEF
jgi:hypothetical protein